MAEEILPARVPKYLAEELSKQDTEILSETREYIEALIEWSERPVENSSDDQGTVVEEMVTCGDETCACMADEEKQGPYLYRYYRESGTLTWEYLGKP